MSAGTPLAGATFEIYQHKIGNLMDQFTTGNNGVGVSKPLPTGRYILKEVVSAKYYKLNDKETDFEIEFSSQIVKFEFTNNVVDASPAALGLFFDEYVTEIMFVFGNVKAGFSSIENPATYATVKPGMPAGF